MNNSESKKLIEQLKLFQTWETHTARLLGGWLPGTRTWEAKHVRWGTKWVPKLIEHQNESKSLDKVIAECRQAVLDNSLAPAQRTSAGKA